MKEKKMEKGMFVGKSNGTLYPMDQIPLLASPVEYIFFI